MKKICAAAGKLFLCVAAMIGVVGVASFAYYGVEEMPESMKCER